MVVRSNKGIEQVSDYTSSDECISLLAQSSRSDYYGSSTLILQSSFHIQLVSMAASTKTLTHLRLTQLT